jgi:hypothetical protein
MMKLKYPRTFHLPFSSSITNDDKVLSSTDIFNEVVITIKMDGENSTMSNEYIHARSLDSSHHPSRDWIKNYWNTIKHDIPEDIRICGENLYAKHSIHYEDLRSYFYGFSVWDDDYCLSWEETELYFDLLNIVSVPVIYKGIFTLNIVNEIINDMNFELNEGFVVRNVDAFYYDDFFNNVGKYVRSGHVQTETHWMHSKLVKNHILF